MMLGERKQLFEKLFRKHLFFLSGDAENYMAEYTMNIIHKTLIIRSTILASQALGMLTYNLSFKNTTKFLT